MRGEIETIQYNQIIGWLWNPADPDTHISFDLIVNGENVGTFIANIKREDLSIHDGENRDHGFCVLLNPDWLSEALNTVTICTYSEYDKNYGIIRFKYKDSHAYDLVSIRPATRAISCRQGLEERRENITKLERTIINREKDEFSKISPIATRPLTYLAVAKSGKPGFEDKPQLEMSLDKVKQLVNIIFKAEGIDEKKVFEIVDVLFRQKNYDDVIIIVSCFVEDADISYRLLNLWARSLLNLNRLPEAIDIFSQVRALEPNRHNAIYYLGVAYAKLKLHREAYDVFVKCAELKHDEFKYNLDAGRQAVLLAFGSYGAAEHCPEYLGRAIEHFQQSAALAPNDYRPIRELAAIYLAQGDLDFALETARQAVRIDVGSLPAKQTLYQIALRAGKFNEALAVAIEAHRLSPTDDWPKFAQRILTRLQTDSPREQTIVKIEFEDIECVTIEQALDILRDIEVSWVIFGQNCNFYDEISFKSLMFGWASIIITSGEPLPFFAAYRRSFLIRLMETGLFPPEERLSNFLKSALQYGSVSKSKNSSKSSETTKQTKQVALLISSFGIHKFGGVEQFLEQMAGLYHSFGYSVVLVGTRLEYLGSTGVIGNFRYTFVENDPEELFKLAVEESATLIHVVSGLGFEIAAAMRHLDVRIVFGIHFWRELFFTETPSGGYFPDIDLKMLPRPDFSILLRDFSAIYCNSIYTRQCLETAFGVRSPILYSLPNDEEYHVDVPFDHRLGILLVNARVDKGFRLLLEIAEKLPDLNFIAIASQSAISVAEAEIKIKDLSNVKVLSKVSDMGEIYKKVKVVLVPSFRFIETFSRVVIEAQRFGVPVIGSDRGNVPILLAKSGKVLKESCELWVAEIRKLCCDPVYWSKRSKLALENSNYYSFVQQEGGLKRILKSLEYSILVGVGSGLGNVIHTTPLLRNISRRLDRRIDVVIAGDYSDLLFVVANKDYVNHVFILNSNVLERRYDLVFLTQSFGNAMPFASPEVLSSRDWRVFMPNGQMHEAEHNLASAKALLEIDYDDSDVRQYFIGDMVYSPPSNFLVGLHGGSKGGIWASKRWPFYEELAAILVARSYQVASFGTPDEYVKGTIDMTGGTIEEMSRSILQCSVFVANDSGVMNIVNALGIPLVALFGPTNVATRGPLCRNSISIAVDDICSPCEIHPTDANILFRGGICKCMEKISVDQVIEAFEIVVEEIQSLNY